MFYLSHLIIHVMDFSNSLTAQGKSKVKYLLLSTPLFLSVDLITGSRFLCI